MFSKFLSPDSDMKGQKRKFKQQEDYMILYCVNILKISDWKIIAANVPGRTSKQVRERYKRYLQQSVNTEPWSQEEDKILEKYVSEMGPQWVKIVTYLPGRSSTNLKNRWATIRRRKMKECKTVSTDKDDFLDYDQDPIKLDPDELSQIDFVF